MSRIHPYVSGWPGAIYGALSYRCRTRCDGLPAASERRRHCGSGSIVALAAEPMDWTISWPELPAPRGVQLTGVASDGAPADLEIKSSWVGKQSRGVLTDCVVVFGNPLWNEATSAVRIAEGVADALALASRYDGPALATFGTSPMRSGNLAVWLANAPAGAIIHCDDDPGGQRAAADLRRAVREAGGYCTAVLPAADGAKDPAAVAAHFAPLRPLPPEWRDYAITLRDCNPTWASWEVYRQAGVIFAAPKDKRVNMTAHDGILAGAELAATGQDYLSELRAWVTAYPEDALIQEEVRQLARDLDAVDEVADRRDAWPITDITGNLPRSLLSVAGCNGAVLTEGSVALLAGAGGVGKSALMVSLALGIARLNDGERGPVVDGIFDGVGGPVILVTYEDVPEVTAWRVRSPGGGSDEAGTGNNTQGGF